MKRTAAGTRFGIALSEAWRAPNPTLRQRALLTSTAPLSLAYALGTRARNLAYDNNWFPSRSVSAPVISVGNLTVGGAGKTPVVLAVAERLAGIGHRVAVVGRGYGGDESDVLVVSDGRGRMCRDAAGDEAVLVASRLDGVVVTGADRYQAARKAISLGATVIVLDDGFQHRRLRRDLEIVVVDSSDPVGNGLPFPMGPLREGLAALDRADIVWLSRVDEKPAHPIRSSAVLRRISSERRCPIVRSRYKPSLLLDGEGSCKGPAELLRGKRAVAVAGVARPSSFLATLASLEVQVVESRLFPDHHLFTEKELASAFDHAESMGALVVTTEKDAVRFPPHRAAEVRVLRVEAEVVEGEDALLEALQNRGLGFRSPKAPGVDVSEP